MPFDNKQNKILGNTTRDARADQPNSPMEVSSSAGTGGAHPAAPSTRCAVNRRRSSPLAAIVASSSRDEGLLVDGGDRYVDERGCTGRVLAVPMLDRDGGVNRVLYAPAVDGTAGYRPAVGWSRSMGIVTPSGAVADDQRRWSNRRRCVDRRRSGQVAVTDAEPVGTALSFRLAG